MTATVVNKSLAGAEDILRGADPVNQVRNGAVYKVNQVHIPVAVSSEANMAAINPADAIYVDVVKERSYASYLYSATDTSGITSPFGGSWIQYDNTNYERSYFNRLYSFTLGTTANDINDAVYNEGDNHFYVWQGTFPKVVPPGSTPASTGGVGPGAWKDVGDASAINYILALLASKDGATYIGYGNRTVADTLPLYTSDWGILPTNTPAQNATNLNTLNDYAIANGRQFDIIVDQDVIVDDVTVPVRKKTEVVYKEGGGKLVGLYRRATIPGEAPSCDRISDDIVPAGMTTFYSASAPTVVIMGDSISTEGPNALSNNDSMWAMIVNKIQNQNPGLAVNAVNRAIGGQTWLNANTQPTAFPAWYTDTSRQWLDYINDLQPDLLILAFGMNDANGFNAGAVHAVVNKIKAWAKVPSLLFVTNPVPAIATTWSGGVGFYETIFQEGRDWAAGYARTYAKYYGYSVLDINRQFCLVRDGRDYTDIPLERINSYNQSYVRELSIGVRDYTVRGDIAAWTVGRVLSVKVGQGNLDTIYVTNSAGKYKITAFSEGSGTPYIDVTTTISVVAGQTLDISVQDNFFTLFSGITQVIRFPIIRTGGEFNAIVEWQDTASSGPFVSVELNGGNWLQCQYNTRDSDIWGHDDGTANTKLPEGGNGINHYSSKGLELIVAPVLEEADFTVKVARASVGIATMAAGTTALTTVRATRQGNLVSLTGRVQRASSGDLFTLPAGFIPASLRIVGTVGFNGTTWSSAVVSIANPTGVVSLSAGSASNMLTLDGINFLVQ